MSHPIPTMEYPKCKYPGCDNWATESPFNCCSPRHGLAYKQMLDAKKDSKLFSVRWRKGIYAENILGDRFEELITIGDLI